MNPAQLAAMATLFSVPTQPRIVGATTNTVAGASLTCDLPHRREAGLLAITIVGGDTTGFSGPTTPTGWTSLVSQSGAVTSLRVAYKFLNGSEDPTFITTQTSAVEMCAVTLTIADCISSRAPTATRNSNIDPPSHTTTAPYGSPLWIVATVAEVFENEIERPIGFTTRNRYSAGISTQNVVVLAENINVQTLDPSAFSFPTAINFQSVTIAVRGA